MPSSNRTQVVSVKEVTVGTTPVTPRMRARRTSGEGLKWTPTFEESGELRTDGMNGPPIKTSEDSGGDIKFELSYPVPSCPEAVDIESALYGAWSDTNSRDNDGTADSVITGVATTNEVLTVVTGVAFVASEIYRFSGFGVAGNNGTFKCTTGSATVPRFLGAGLTDEAVPPAAARVKCVGLQGAAADITATATGLASTALDFTTIPGLVPGKWIKIGGSAVGDKFATGALNTYVRITAVAAHALTCDNLPSGWATDLGTGKTIKVFFGDQIKNGTTQVGQSFERGFLGQAVPTYVVQPGMVVKQLRLELTAKQMITGSVLYDGMTGASQGAASLDAVPDAATSSTTYPPMACGANVGRIGEAGAPLAAPNFVHSLSIVIDNVQTNVDSIDTIGTAAITGHARKVSGKVETYFGDNTLLTKFFGGTLTSLNARITQSNRTMIITLPQITYNSEGAPNADAKDKDVMLPLGFLASKEETITGATILIDRFEFVE